jgi:hypothetical protein
MIQERHKDQLKKVTSVKPIYGQDYAPGYDLYTYNYGSGLSEGIVWFQSIDEVIAYSNLLKVRGFSHVLSVVDEESGIEASEGGVARCQLSKYFNDPNELVVCREPLGLTDIATMEKNKFLMSKIGAEYDYTGLVLGFTAATIAQIQNIFPFWRKLPLPFHTNGAYVCSSLQADAWKHTQLYWHLKLFEDWNITRITPNKLWNNFPYKGFKVNVKRHKWYKKRVKKHE